jgi:cytochrome c-type biogenesis protein CcsB
MSLIQFEIVLGNISFFVLFLTMLIYWVQAAFFFKNNSQNKFSQASFFGTLLGNILLALLLIVRWIETNHFPLSNLYESLIFLAWGLGLILLLLEDKKKESFLGILFSPMILFVDAFATLSLPQQMQQSAPLVPALKSNWLIMHVSIMMLSYSALIAGSLIAIAFLVVTATAEEKIISQSLKNLDQLSYRTLGLGFPLLTLGILSGAIWANEAWGSYWSWDPKETWALITWFIFAIYFHFRISYGWEGRRPAWVATLGFFFLWVAYLGVNLFGSGLHSYGWIK